MSPIRLCRHEVTLLPESARVIIRPFVPSDVHRITTIIGRALALTEDEVVAELAAVRREFDSRHFDIEGLMLAHFAKVRHHVFTQRRLTRERELLIGALFSGEYALESAAIFNPSIVPHPDQAGLSPGALRFIMSLRATGEGHVSSIVFRTGVVNPDDTVSLDTLPERLHRSQMLPDRQYVRGVFKRKLVEMGMNMALCSAAIDRLPERFTLDELRAAIGNIKGDNAQQCDAVRKTVLWLAESNYHIEVAPDARLDELAIFPMSPDESHGMEDLRLTRFVDDDGSITYHGTYTAYNGVRTLPMLLSTNDFRRIEFHSLNGKSALNKGMALFPRRINGRYVMCSRIDGESLFIATSDAMHFWESADLLIRPKHPWELMQIGNCGPPIETPRGWLLLTHGVGPMRTYSIGAIVLDLEDPRKVIGHLREPLLAPTDAEREGYVPNVVYTCGSLQHLDDLFIPFALADTSTSLAVVTVNALIDQAMADYESA